MTTGIALDFKTLLIVYVAIRLIQAGGLAHVLNLNRHYVPARLWVLGATLIATGSLLTALQGPATALRS